MTTSNNTFEEGKDTEKSNHFNFIAFLFPLIWSLAKKLYVFACITLVLFVVGSALVYILHIPRGLALIIMLLWRMYLGFSGNTEVIRKEKEKDVDEIKKREKKNKYAIIGIIISFMACFYLVLFSLTAPTHRYNHYITNHVPEQKCDTTCSWLEPYRNIEITDSIDDRDY